LLAKEKSYKVFYKALLAKGLSEKYISKTILKRPFSDFAKGLFQNPISICFMQIKTFGHFTLILWKVVLIMKTCLLLFSMVVLNFRNFAKLVWIDLDQI
jgi:hypothetical protein